MKNDFFKPTKKCLWCGKPIMCDEKSNTWVHIWDRWKGDNGYYCTKKEGLSANPNSKEKQKSIDDGWYIFQGNNVTNAYTKEIKVYSEIKKEYGICEED